MPAIKLTAILAIAVLMASLSACGLNSTITHSQVDKKLLNLEVEGVLVTGVAREQSARIDFENAFAKALRRRGETAIASHTLLPDKGISAEQLVAAAGQAGLGTILVTRYMGQQAEEIYHPGTIYYGVAPVYGAGYYRGFPGYYGHAYEVAYKQPVYTANVTHTLVSDLYITSTREHAWQAVSETIQAGSIKKLRNDAIDALIKNLKQEGLLD